MPPAPSDTTNAHTMPGTPDWVAILPNGRVSLSSAPVTSRRAKAEFQTSFMAPSTTYGQACLPRVSKYN